ncbi:MAG: AI-2E family transporter [Acidobacteriaceae bacterium]|nr:AI-2E family transporter [Acidobacteriaceae bacterium]
MPESAAGGSTTEKERYVRARAASYSQDSLVQRQAPAVANISQSSHLSYVITGAVVIAALYFGKALVVPFAFAVLLSFLLSTPVVWLEKLKLGKSFSVFVVLTITVAFVGAMVWLGIVQVSGIVRSLPQYRNNVIRKLEALQNPAGSGILRGFETISELSREVTANRLKTEKKGNPAQADTGQPPSAVNPVPVEVVKPGNSVLPSLGIVSTSVGEDLAEALAVIVLTLFMLLNRTHLRNRLLRFMGRGHLVLMTTAIDDAAHRVSQYLLTQSLVNGMFGLILATGLYFIGVPYAPFWGVLVAVLRFIPYVGTFIAGACPFLLSLVVLDGWRRPLLTAGLYLAIELTISSVIEPWLYATRTGISSLAILISAAFWTLLWGPIGLVLSTPLTVCLAVLGRYLPPLEFLYVLLGDEPVLATEVRYYQRLLAEDEDEAAEVLETSLKDKSLTEVYDSVVIPALTLAETDRHENRLSEQKSSFVYQATRELVEDVGERHPILPHAAVGVRVGCVPSRDEADAVVAAMLAQLLRQRGIEADVIRGDDGSGCETLVVSALPPFAIMHARSWCRKLKKRHPGARILLGVWNSLLPAEDIRQRLGADGADSVVITLEQALNDLYPSEVPTVAEHAAAVT